MGGYDPNPDPNPYNLPGQTPSIPGLPYAPGSPGWNNPIGGGYTASDLPLWGGNQTQFNNWMGSTNFSNPNPYTQGTAEYNLYNKIANNTVSIPQPQTQVTTQPSTPSYDMSTAAGQAAYVQHMGGTLDPGVYKKAVDQGFTGMVNAPGFMTVGSWEDARATVPLRDYSSNAMDKLFSMPVSLIGNVPGVTMFVPWGDKSQIAIDNAKIGFAPGGAYQIYSGNMVVAGGGDYALQSGTVSGKPQTPIVYAQGGGNVSGMTPMWSANQTALVQDIQKNPQNYSDIGSELYPKGVQLLTGITIEGEAAKGNIIQPGVYPQDAWNYANLVKFADSNLPKGFTGVQWLPMFAPKTINTDPVFTAIDKDTGKTTAVYPGFGESAPVTVVNVPGLTMEGAGLPTPFSSTGKSDATLPGTGTEIQKSVWDAAMGFFGGVFGGGGTAQPLAPITNTSSKSTYSISGSNDTIFDLRADVTTQKSNLITMQNELTMLSAGNIKDGKWIGSEPGFIEYTTKANQYNALIGTTNAKVDVLNQMEIQNPQVITNTTATTTTKITTTPETKDWFQINIMDKLGGIGNVFQVPKTDLFGGTTGGKESPDQNFLNAFKKVVGMGGIAGTVGYASAPELFSGAGGLALDTTAISPAAVPFAWLAGGVVGTTLVGMGLEWTMKEQQAGAKSNWLNNNPGKTTADYEAYRASIQNPFEYVSPGESKATVEQTIEGGLKVQEMWEDRPQVNVPGGFVLPKIVDVPESQLFNAPGQGYNQVMNIPGRGFVIIAGLPGMGKNILAKAEGAISPEPIKKELPAQPIDLVIPEIPVEVPRVEDAPRFDIVPKIEVGQTVKQPTFEFAEAPGSKVTPQFNAPGGLVLPPIVPTMPGVLGGAPYGQLSDADNKLMTDVFFTPRMGYTPQSISDMVSVLQRNQERPVSGLISKVYSPTYKSVEYAVELYTGRDFSSMARVVRGSALYKDPVMGFVATAVYGKHAIDLAMGIEKFGADVRGRTLYRGVQGTGTKKLEKKFVGDVYTPGSIRSFAGTKEVALLYSRGSNILLEYKPSDFTPALLDPVQQELIIKTKPYYVIGIREEPVEVSFHKGKFENAKIYTLSDTPAKKQTHPTPEVIETVKTTTPAPFVIEHADFVLDSAPISESKELSPYDKWALEVGPPQAIEPPKQQTPQTIESQKVTEPAKPEPAKKVVIKQKKHTVEPETLPDLSAYGGQHPAIIPFSQLASGGLLMGDIDAIATGGFITKSGEVTPVNVLAHMSGGGDDSGSDGGGFFKGGSGGTVTKPATPTLLLTPALKPLQSETLVSEEKPKVIITKEPEKTKTKSKTITPSYTRSYDRMDYDSSVKTGFETVFGSFHIPSVGQKSTIDSNVAQPTDIMSKILFGAEVQVSPSTQFDTLSYGAKQTIGDVDSNTKEMIRMGQGVGVSIGNVISIPKASVEIETATIPSYGLNVKTGEVSAITEMDAIKSGVVSKFGVKSKIKSESHNITKPTFATDYASKLAAAQSEASGYVTAGTLWGTKGGIETGTRSDIATGEATGVSHAGSTATSITDVFATVTPFPTSYPKVTPVVTPYLPKYPDLPEPGKPRWNIDIPKKIGLPILPFPGGSGGQSPAHGTKYGKYTEYLGFAMQGKPRAKTPAAVATKRTPVRIVKVPVAVHSKPRQHQIFGIAGPQLPSPTSTPVQQNAVLIRPACKKGFAQPVKPARMPRMSVTPFKVPAKRKR